jgi:hypothetical protein
MSGHFSPRGLARLALLLACALPLHAASLKLARGPHGSGRAHVMATFDGHRQLCVIDSGSVLTIVADEKFASYPSLGSFRFQSASGIAAAGDKIRIGSIRLDRRAFTNVLVARVEQGDKLRSTIGLNLLALQPFSLLFRDEASLHLGRKAIEGTPGPIKPYASGMSTIPVRLGGANRMAVWDTGAELTAVDREFVAANPGLFAAGRAIGNVVDGNDQAVAAQLWTMKELTIGRRVFRNVRVVAVDFATIHQGTAPDVHLVIGFNVIRTADWYFDHPGRRWEVR